MISIRFLAVATALILEAASRRSPAPASLAPAPRTRFADGATDCPVSRIELHGQDLWCASPCTAYVRAPGAASPVTIRCSLSATTQGSGLRIEIGTAGELDRISFTVEATRDGAGLAGAGFAGDEVSAGAIADTSSYAVSCGDGRRGRAVVTIGPAIVTSQSADPIPTRWWAVHGSASATLLRCDAPEGAAMGPAEVEVTF